MHPYRGLTTISPKILSKFRSTGIEVEAIAMFECIDFYLNLFFI
jgi:hypothetical protein